MQTCIARPDHRGITLHECVQVYTELRREAGMTHAMPVAVRHLESMIRMSEAHARMHLREKVEPQDIDIAIRLMLESFIQVRATPLASRAAAEHVSRLCRPVLCRAHCPAPWGLCMHAR